MADIGVDFPEPNVNNITNGRNGKDSLMVIEERDRDYSSQRHVRRGRYLDE